MENVILTPHCAARSPKIPDRFAQVVVDNVRRYAAGRPVKNAVDKNAWF